jgi:DNA invertase Pin-like site-specific DNA recombinase
MPTAFSYARFSSVRQKRGSSLERQQAMVATWLASHPDYSLSETRFQDLGKSGWHGHHIKEGGGFADLLAAVEAGVIKSGDAILVESIDRAGRLSTLDMMTKIINPILQQGVEIITLDDNVSYNLTSVEGDGQIYMLVGKIKAARGYSENLSRRLKASYTSRRNSAVLGVTPKRNTPVWLTSTGIIVPEVAEQVKLAFEYYASGLGKTVISKRMRESGVPQLAKCTGPGVEGWLRNEAAVGRWNGSNVYEPIIDISLFQRAQLESEKRKTAPRAKTPAHFLVGLVKCGSCGGNFIMRTINGVQVSMRCRKRQEMKGCPNKKVIPKEVVDAVYGYTSVMAAREAVEREFTGVNEKAIFACEVKRIEFSKQLSSLAEAIRIAGATPEFLESLKGVMAEQKRNDDDLALLKATLVPKAENGWRQQGEVWKLERDDSQRLAAMLRGVGYSITIDPNATLTSSHSKTAFRFASVDRKTGSYKLHAGEKLILIPKVDGKDYEYYEPFDHDHVVTSEWLDEDYEDLRRQYQD